MSFFLALLAMLFAPAGPTAPEADAPPSVASRVDLPSLPLAVDRRDAGFDFSSREVGLPDPKEESESEEDGTGAKLSRAILDAPSTSPLLASRLAQSVSQRTILGFGPSVRSSFLRC